jgi:hypothetical protein
VEFIYLKAHGSILMAQWMIIKYPIRYNISLFTTIKPDWV